MKNSRVLAIINMVLIIYIFTLSIGYAFFSESLTIKGVASTVDFYSGENLPLTPTIRDLENNTYYTASDTKKYVDFTNETWEGNTYTLNFEKKVGIVIGEKTIDYVVTFTNPTVLSYTNGEAAAEIIENNNDRIKGVDVSLSKNEIAPGESVDITFTVNFNFLTEIGDHQVKATVTYLCQNKPKYFYFIINYD